MIGLIRTFACVVLFAVLACAPVASAEQGSPADDGTADSGPFAPTMDSLKKNFVCPEWFRDAKFGIWSHWGPASIPGINNGYPEDMYRQVSASYKWHLEHYGHPSKVGYKDVIASWKAEKFDPDALMKKYKAAGAKYFVALATHHDNFDNFNSTWNPWNSVKVGPHKDIVGLWREAALKEGLRFGVSWHADQRGWDYMHRSYDSDTTGPLAGVPYDGRDPANVSLYNPPHEPKTKPTKDWLDRWTKRQIELCDRYKPDLLYFDGGINFPKEGGLEAVAHFLNQNAKDHGGRCEGVVNTKNEDFVRDYERGVSTVIREKPWQDDTSLGGWFFLNDRIADYHSRSKDTATVIDTLVDVVSKNGNLLINFPQRGDGSLYPECEKVLDDLAEWMPINGEALFASRPWTTFGEGPSVIPDKYMNELKKPLTAEDIRFTTKDGCVYAICLAVPDKPVRITSMGERAGKIVSVKLLGSPDTAAWKQGPDALTIELPPKWPCKFAVTYKVKFGN